MDYPCDVCEYGHYPYSDMCPYVFESDCELVEQYYDFLESNPFWGEDK